MNNNRLPKTWIRIITCIIIITFLPQNIAWAKGPSTLMPDNKEIINSLIESLAKPGISPDILLEKFEEINKDPSFLDKLTQEETEKLINFIRNYPELLPSPVKIIFEKLLKKSTAVTPPPDIEEKLSNESKLQTELRHMLVEKPKPTKPDLKGKPILLTGEPLPPYKELEFIGETQKIDKSRHYNDRLIVWNRNKTSPEELYILEGKALTAEQRKEYGKSLKGWGKVYQKEAPWLHGTGKNITRGKHLEGTYFIISKDKKIQGYLSIGEDELEEYAINPMNKNGINYKGVGHEILALAFHKLLDKPKCKKIFIHEPSQRTMEILKIRSGGRISVSRRKANKFLKQQKIRVDSLFEEKIGLEMGNGIFTANSIYTKTHLCRDFLDIVQESINYYKEIPKGKTLTFYLQNLFARPPNKESERLVLKIARSHPKSHKKPLGTNSARYYLKDLNEVVIVLDEEFIKLLLKYKDHFPNGIKWLFIERLTHELYHDNEINDIKSESDEEVKIIFYNDIGLYKTFVYQKELGTEMDKLWHTMTKEERKVIQSMRFFKMIKKAVESADKIFKKTNSAILAKEHVKTKIVIPFVRRLYRSRYKKEFSGEEIYSHKFRKDLRDALEEALQDTGFESGRIAQILNRGLSWSEEGKVFLENDDIFEITARVLNKVLRKKADEQITPEQVKAVTEYHEMVHIILRNNRKIINKVKEELSKLKTYNALVKYFSNQYGQYRPDERIVEELITNYYTEKILINLLELLDDKGELITIEKIDERISGIIERYAQEEIDEINIRKLKFGNILEKLNELRRDKKEHPKHEKEPGEKYLPDSKQKLESMTNNEILDLAKKYNGHINKMAESINVEENDLSILLIKRGILGDVMDIKRKYYLSLNWKHVPIEDIKAEMEIAVRGMEVRGIGKVVGFESKGEKGDTILVQFEGYLHVTRFPRSFLSGKAIVPKEEPAAPEIEIPDAQKITEPTEEKKDEPDKFIMDLIQRIKNKEKLKDLKDKILSLKEIWRIIQAYNRVLEEKTSWARKMELWYERNYWRGKIWDIFSKRQKGRINLKWKEIADEIGVSINEFQKACYDYLIEIYKGDLKIIKRKNKFLKLNKKEIERNNLISKWHLTKVLGKIEKNKELDDKEKYSVINEFILCDCQKDPTFPSFSYTAKIRIRTARSCYIPFAHWKKKGKEYNLRMTEGVKGIFKKGQKVRVTSTFDKENYGWIFKVESAEKVLHFIIDYETGGYMDLIDPVQQLVVDAVKPNKINVFGNPIKPLTPPFGELDTRHGSRLILEMIRHNKFTDSNLILYPFRISPITKYKKEKLRFGMLDFGFIKENNYRAQVKFGASKYKPDYLIKFCFSKKFNSWICFAYEILKNGNIAEKPIFAFTGEEKDGKTRLYQMEEDELKLCLEEMDIGETDASNIQIILNNLFGLKNTDELLKFIKERGISLEELHELLNAFSDTDISKKQIIEALNPLYLRNKIFKEEKQKINELEKKDKRLARLRHLITDYFDKNITEEHIKELTGKQIKFSQLLDEYPYLALQFITNLSREKLAKIGAYHLERYFPSASKAIALAFPELDISDAYFGNKPSIWERLPISAHIRFVERLLQELERIRQIIIKDKLSEEEIRLIEELKLDKRGKRLLKQLPLLKDKSRLSNLKGEIFHIAIGKIPVHLSEGFFVLYRRLRKKERPDLTFLEYLFQKLGLKDERGMPTLELIEEEIRKEFEKGLIQKAYTSSAVNIICANLGIEKRGKLKDEVTRLFYTYKFYEILKGIRKRIGEKTKGLKDEEEIRKIRQEELEPLMYTKIKSTHSYLLAGLIKYYKNYKEVFEKSKDKIKEILGFEIDYEKDITGVKYISDIVEWLKGKRKEPPKGSYINIGKGVPYTLINRKDLHIYMSLYNITRSSDSKDGKYWRSFSQDNDGKNKYLLIWNSETSAKSIDAQPLIKIQLVENGIILAQKIDGVKTGRKPKVIEKRLIDKVDAISAQEEAEKPKIDINPGDIWLLLYDDLKVAFTVLKVDVENKIIIINNKLLGTKRISLDVFNRTKIERKNKGKIIIPVKTEEKIPAKEEIKQQDKFTLEKKPSDVKRGLFKGGYIDITYEGVEYKAKIEQIEGDNVCINIPGRGMKIFSFAWLKRKYEKNNNLKGVLILPGLPGMLGFITILTLQNNPHLVYIKEIWEYLKIRIEHFKNWLFDNIDFCSRPALGGVDTLFIATLFMAIVGISIILLPPGQTTSSLSELPYLIYPVILMAGISGKGPREPNPVSKMAAEFSKGNYENAFKLKDNALKYAENDPIALVDIYNILAQIHRVRGGLYRSKREIYQSDKEYGNALNCIERALNIINKTRMGISVLTPAPNVFPPLNNLKSIEKLNEKHIATLFNKGMIYSFIGKHDKAIDAFTDVLQRISGNHKLYQITKAYLGMCYYHINNFNKSEELLKESIGDTYTPQELVYEFLALIYFYRDKDCKTALEYLKKAYKPENADSDESTKNRIEFWRWMIYSIEGDNQNAMDSLDRAIKYQKNVIRSNFVEMGKAFLSASNNKISTVMEYLGYMENKLGREFMSEFLRSLLTTNAGTLDITDYRDTIMRLFKFQDTTGYIYWLLEEYIGKKIEIEDKGLLTAVIEAVNTHQNEGKENNVEQIKQLDIVRATPQLVYAISGKLKVNEFKGILKTENEVLAEIENAVELYKSKKTKDAHKITVSLIDKLITLPSLHPPEKIKIIVELLHIDGNLLNEPGLEDSFKKIISWMDNMGIDKEILAIANHYLGNLYLDAKVSDKAIEYFKNVIQLSSDPKIKTAANYNLGLIYYDKFKKTTNPEEKEGLTKIVIEFLKEGLYHPYAYIVLAFSYAELEDHVNVLNALVEIRKNQKELEKGGFNIDKMVINSIKNLLHILIKEEDLDEFLCLFKYIGELEDLDILNLFKRFRKLGGNGLIKILFKILDDDSYKVQYKKKLIQLLTGLDLTGSNKELLGILKKQAQKFKEQNISFLFEAIDLINGCLTNDMKDFLLGLEGTPHISNKQNRYKVQIEKISNILDTIDNFFNIQGLIEKGQSYLTPEEWRLSVIDYIPKDQEEWHEYMLERETEKFMIEFNFLRQDVVRNRIIDAYKGNLPIETLRNNLSSLNREMQDKFISDITLIDDSLEKAKELMKNKKWQDTYNLLRVIIEGDINGNKVGCEWYLKNTALDKTQEIRRKLTLAWQLMDLAYLAFMEPKVYERMRFIIKKWQDKEEEWNTIPQDEILELAKAFYFTWLEKSFIQPIDKNDSYETLLQNSYKVISLFPQEKLKDDLYLMMWYLKIMNIAGAEGFKEKFEELKKIDNPWIIYNIGKFIRERGMPEESLGYYLKALDGIDKEGDKILYENVLSSLMSNMCGLRMHTEVANLVEGKLTGIEDVDLAISGASTLNSVGRHLESLETLQWLINKSMSKELHSEVCLQIGICFYHMERYSEALKWHEKAKELNPLNTRMWNNLSVIYYEKGDINKTIIFMEESLRSGYIVNPTSIIEDIIENAVKGKPIALKFFDALLRECPELQEIIRKEMKSYGFSIEKTNGNIYIRITFKINQLEESFTLPINEFKGQYIFCRIKEKIMAHLKTNYPFIIEINGLKAVEDLVYEEIEEQIKSKKLLETSEIEKVLIKASAYALRTEKNLRIPTLLIEETLSLAGPKGKPQDVILDRLQNLTKLGKGENNRIYIAQSNEPPYKEVIVIKLSNNITRKKLAGFIRENEHRIRRFINAFKEDNGEVHIEIEAEDDSVYELAEKIIKNNFLYPQQVMPEIEDFITNDNNTQTENNGGTTLSGTTPDSYIRQGEESEKEFFSQIEKIRKNDITDKYKEKIIQLFESALPVIATSPSVIATSPSVIATSSSVIATSSSVIASEAKQSLTALKENYKIYGFNSIVKGKDDFLLGWNNTKNKELFIAEDVISELEARGPPTLVEEYLLHEILCPIFGHYPSILIQQKLFRKHYPDGQKLKSQTPQKPYKGLLGNALREIINKKADDILESEAQKIRTYLKDRFKPKVVEEIVSSGLDYIEQGVLKGGATVLQLAEYLAILKKNKLIRPIHRPVRLIYLEGAEFKFRIKDKILGTIPNLIVLAIGHEDMAYEHIKWIHLHRFVKIEISNEEIPDYLVKTIKEGYMEKYKIDKKGKGLMDCVEFNLYKEKENRIYRAILTGDFYVITFYYENFDDFGLSKKLNIRPEEALRLIKSLTGRIHVKIEKGISRRKEINDIITGYIKDNGILQKLDRRFYYVPGKKRPYIHIWCQSTNLYIKMDLKGNVFDSVSEREEIYYPPKKINNISDLTDNINQAIEYYSRNNQTISKRIEQKDKKPLLTSILIWLFITIGLPSSLWAKELFAPSLVLGHLSLSGLLNTISIILVIISALCFTYILYQHLKYRKTNLSRRRFIRNTAIILLGGSILGYIGDKLAQYLLDPASKAKRKIIEELKRFASEIKDTKSREYANSFIDCFEENGFLTDISIENKHLDMKGVIKYNPLEKSAEVNSVVYKLNRISPDTVQASMVHEGAHIEDFEVSGNPFCAKLMALWNYFKNKKFEIEKDNIIENKKWKKFPDTDTDAYLFILLELYLFANIEANAYIAEYNFYRSKFGDLRDYLKDFKIDTYKDFLLRLIYESLKNGKIDKLDEYEFKRIKITAKIWQDITWEDFKKYFSTRMLHLFLELNFSGAIKPDGSVDINKVKRNYIINVAKELKGLRERLLFKYALYIEQTRGTAKDVDYNKLTYTVVNPDKFLDWLDTGIFIDRKGNKINLMELDTTIKTEPPKTNSRRDFILLPYMVPSFSLEPLNLLCSLSALFLIKFKDKLKEYIISHIHAPPLLNMIYCKYLVKYAQSCHCEDGKKPGRSTRQCCFANNLDTNNTGLLRFARNDGVHRIFTIYFYIKNFFQEIFFNIPSYVKTPLIWAGLIAIHFVVFNLIPATNLAITGAILDISVAIGIVGNMVRKQKEVIDNLDDIVQIVDGKIELTKEGKTKTFPQNPAIATSGMYTPRQHKKTNKKIDNNINRCKKYIKIWFGDNKINIDISPWLGLAESEQNKKKVEIIERMNQIINSLDEEIRKALLDSTLYLLPSENPNYPYYLRTEIKDGKIEEYQIAHAGSFQGKARNVFMTIPAFIELPIYSLNKILQRETRLAWERYLERNDGEDVEKSIEMIVSHLRSGNDPVSLIPENHPVRQFLENNKECIKNYIEGKKINIDESTEIPDQKLYRYRNKFFENFSKELDRLEDFSLTLPELAGLWSIVLEYLSLEVERKEYIYDYCVIDRHELASMLFLTYILKKHLKYRKPIYDLYNSLFDESTNIDEILSEKEALVFIKRLIDNFSRFKNFIEKIRENIKSDLTKDLTDCFAHCLQTMKYFIDRLNEKGIYYKLTSEGYTKEVEDILFEVSMWEMVKEIYPDLVENIKAKYPGWQPFSMEELWNILITDKLPRKLPNLVLAMRADGIIDEEDFIIITDIGKIVENTISSTELTVNMALITKAISASYLKDKAGLDKGFKQKISNELNKIGYGSRAKIIVMLLEGLKYRLKKDGGSYSKGSYSDFIKGLEKLLGDNGISHKIGVKKRPNLNDIKGNGKDSIIKYWTDIFELNLEQWEILEMTKDKKPAGIIVQDIKDLGPGIQNWLEGIKRHNIDISGIKMGYITEGLSEAEIKKLTASKPENVILGNSLEEIKERAQTGNIVYLANENKLNKYKNTGKKLVGKGRAGPVIELSWCLLMLTADDLKNTHKEFLNKMVELKLINEDQVNELEDPYYIILPKVEKVLEMWNELQEGASYLDIWV